jgi:two-component sensor histidine kinase
VVGGTPRDWFKGATAEGLSADLRKATASNEVLQRELRLDSAAGARLWDTRFVSLPSSAGAREQVLLVASDVTEQRAEAQARFEAAIAQREMLVKEVHHRIKNNLQGVAGLLQQNAARHPEVAAILTESVGQVQAIAQVYGLQVGSAGPLRVASVVEAIALSVQRTFGRTVTVRVHGDEPGHLLLPEAESIPIALTINELLTNAVKHGAQGEVQCELSLQGEALRVAIRNAGRLREGFSLAQFPGGVSGLGLVRALLPRRSATLTLSQQGDEVLTEVLLLPPSVQREGA